MATGKCQSEPRIVNFPPFQHQRPVPVVCNALWPSFRSAHISKTDDIIIHSKMRIYAFSKKELSYLGHVVGQGGIQSDPENIKVISEMRAPTDLTGV